MVPLAQHAKFYSPKVQNPNLQPLTLPSGSSHCPEEPGHRPGIRLEVSPPGDTRAGARRAQGPPRTDTFPTEERPGPRDPGALDSTSHPDLAFRPAQQLAKPAGPDLSREIPQELHCLQQRASRVLAEVAERGRSHHRGEAQTTPTSKPAEAPTTRQPLRQDLLGLPACTQPRAHPWGHSPPDANSCSRKPTRLGKGLSNCQSSTLARGL